jgi:hypothetical protein
MPGRVSLEKEDTKPVLLDQIPRFEDQLRDSGIRSHIFNNPPVVSASGQDSNPWTLLQGHMTQLEPDNGDETPKKN